MPPGTDARMLVTRPDWVRHPGYPILSIDIHPDGTRVATAGGDNKASFRPSVCFPFFFLDASQFVLEWQQQEGIKSHFPCLLQHPFLLSPSALKWQQVGIIQRPCMLFACLLFLINIAMNVSFLQHQEGLTRGFPGYVTYLSR